MAPAESTFDSFQAYYDIMVNWSARLARESPLFQRIFQSVHAHRVLDCACGTGQHACLFARWGMDTAASDISEQMVRRTKHLAETMGLSVEARQVSYDELSKSFEVAFDAAVCIGNSLSAAKSRAVVAAAVAELHKVLRPGGALLVQVLNYERLPPGENFYGEPQPREHLGQNYIFLKSWRRAGTTCDMDIIVLEQGASGAWTRTVFRERLLILDRATLVALVEQAGFGKVKLYGGYDLGPFEPQLSQDLILVARRE
jgi:SAM-dependent methyltransferase